MNPTTSRRGFLKTGAFAAAPLAMAVPTAALANDGSKERLARLEDEKALAGLHRELVRQVNCGERPIAGVTALVDDPSGELQIAFAEDGRGATCRRTCNATFRTEFSGDSTIEQMHRLQGQGLHSHDESRELVAKYVKGKHGWTIEKVRLA